MPTSISLYFDIPDAPADQPSVEAYRELIEFVVDIGGVLDSLRLFEDFQGNDVEISKLVLRGTT